MASDVTAATVVAVAVAVAVVVLQERSEDCRANSKGTRLYLLTSKDVTKIVRATETYRTPGDLALYVTQSHIECSSRSLNPADSKEACMTV